MNKKEFIDDLKVYGLIYNKYVRFMSERIRRYNKFHKQYGPCLLLGFYFKKDNYVYCSFLSHRTNKILHYNFPIEIFTDEKELERLNKKYKEEQEHDKKLLEENNRLYRRSQYEKLKEEFEPDG